MVCVGKHAVMRCGVNVYELKDFKSCIVMNIFVKQLV